MDLRRLPAALYLPSAALSLALGLVLLVPERAVAWPPPLVEPDPLAGGPSAPQPFPVPEALRSSVQFWRDLFLQHPSDRVVVHDRENMEIVWRVIELPKDEDGSIDESKSQKLVRAEVEDLRLRLRRLASDLTPLDEEDRILVALAGGPKSPRLAGAYERLRTQRGVADHFRAGLERAQRWVTPMQEALAAEGVPPEIVVLPFVESMFNPNARSYVGALGLWQLMPATARGLGLKVTRGLDERTDILKATRAAARLLKQNYRMLGSWPLAITAYNHGPNGVRRAVDLVGSTDLVYLIDNYQKSTWGFASKNFYAEFLAALSIIHDRAVDELNQGLLVSEAASVRY